MNDKDFEKLASTFGFAPSRALRELLDAATAQAALDERERLSAEHMTVLALQQHSYEREIQIEVEAEREACAQVCEEVSLQAVTAWKLAYQPQDQGREMGADECAAAIRARSSAAPTP